MWKKRTYGAQTKYGIRRKKNWNRSSQFRISNIRLTFQRLQIVKKVEIKFVVLQIKRRPKYPLFSQNHQEPINRDSEDTASRKSTQRTNAPHWLRIPTL